LKFITKHILKKNILFSILFFFIFLQINFAQKTSSAEKYTAHNKGKFYIYWGGNRESFSKSNIHFKGDGYDFTLYDVQAKDKPKGWHVDYVNPARMTIPQTNFRIGYFFTDHYNVSIGLDHMKYVVTPNQIVNIKGYIDGIPPFNGLYNNDPIALTEDFLKFEHTDGLNYINTEICRVDDISSFLNLTNTDFFQINIIEGVGTGILLPKTNATLLGKKRHDDFHISGYGVSAKVGLNLIFFKHFFIQAELKGGYIDMPDIRTTDNSSDRASQHFYFLQRIITFGGIFKL